MCTRMAPTRVPVGPTGLEAGLPEPKGRRRVGMRNASSSSLLADPRTVEQARLPVWHDRDPPEQEVQHAHDLIEE